MAETQTTTLYPQYRELDHPEIEREVRAFWESADIFARSVKQRDGAPSFTFYEGPPSANGTPGIHHVLSRTLKDLFCRYQTLKGKQVARRAGWDTHGLPVEIQVEKALGITKQDIGTKISVAEYNRRCREDVMKFKHRWEELTRLMGYWVDMEQAYITYTDEYIESVWHLLKRLYDKNLLYKGYTIQPYSPAAGTGLSSHELNMPGCYKPVKDTSCVAQFLRQGTENEFFLAWTTTPWTLPANAALAVGENITYVKVDTYNPYTFIRVTVWLAEAAVGRYFSPDCAELAIDAYKAGDKKIPYRIVESKKGAELAGLRYEQLIPYIQPEDAENAFRVIVGDFVSTEDGTGIVHIAPTFGADDFRVAQKNAIPAITVRDANGEPVPIVNREGRYVKEMREWAGRFVKDEYYDANEPKPERSLDVDICITLKERNRAFKVEKYEHNYPHCWRTDKPVLYYPLDSWFVRTSAYRERLVALNREINWKPAATGTGRFENWLENLVDWNLSRSRYWGVPLPVWLNEDRSEVKCIGSIAELRTEIAHAVEKGLMASDPTANSDFELHRPWIDAVILADSQGRPMRRETDLIDVWFDSGAMPFAQWHYPFEHQAEFGRHFPADFIAEGVDQTRGWFFTLHAIAVMLEDKPAFKNVIANGLVLDEHGQKMSKRLGNSVDPFETLGKYGADPTRWYMIENNPPWENLRFNLNHLDETRRRFFGTLFNTYSFFALYANIDGYVSSTVSSSKTIAVADRPELDRWIISRLHSLIREVERQYDDYDATRAVRAIQHFTVEELSNWYVRLARRRFWKGTMTDDKLAAYETLYTCLKVIAQLMSPVAPHFADWLYRNLVPVGFSQLQPSVHLTDFPISEDANINVELEAQMQMAQDICSLVRGIRRKVNIKVRQPLQKMLIPALTQEFRTRIEAVAPLILSEVNVKEIEFISPESGQIVKKIKPDFRALGPRLGAKMKEAAAAIAALSQADIAALERNGEITISIANEPFVLNKSEVEITTQDIPGWSVATEGGITVALDITVTDSLRNEGIARDLINRIQNIRKELDFEVTDHIQIVLLKQPAWADALSQFGSYIQAETLCTELIVTDSLTSGMEIDIDEVKSVITLKQL